MQAQMLNKRWWVSNTDARYLFVEMEKMLKHAGFGVLDSMSYDFKPYGFTGIFLLSESHFAIHTFPEQNKAYLELSSCVEKQFKNFIETLENEFKDVIIDMCS